MNESKDETSTRGADDIALDEGTEEAPEAATEAAVDPPADSAVDSPADSAVDSPAECDDDPQAPIEEETDPLEELRAEAARWQDLALRSQADLDNYRKRMAREKGEALKNATASLLEDLLPVLDNFDRGLQAARGDESSTIYQGMLMVLKQIEDFLEDQGVEPIDTTGADFDPNIHEAVGHQFSDTFEEGKVIRELRRGFKFRDRLLRASNIVVSKGPQEGAPANESPPGEQQERDA